MNLITGFYDYLYKGGIELFQKSFYILLVLIALVVSGCSDTSKESKEFTVTIDTIDAKEVLTLDTNADIFKYDGVIYKTNIEWVEELQLTKDIQIGEIKIKNTENTDFKDEMSNKLPVGTKIYSTKERGDILIVEFEEETKKYLAIVEG